MRILVLQLKRIGDLILTTPALVALRQKYPDASITLCVMEGCAGLLPTIPAVSQTVVINRRKNAATFIKLALRNYDICLDFTGNDRSALLSVLSKASRRITFGWVQRSRTRAMFYNELVDSSVRENHTVDHYLDLLKPLGIGEEARETPITLTIPEDAVETAKRLLASQEITGPYIVVHPGTARVEKYWVPERWAAVIDHCQRTYNLPCVITGAADSFEKAHLDLLTAAMKTPVHNLTGRMSLPVLAALIRDARLLLSMDSAPVHLGAAFRTPQVSLFGQTNPFHWRARHAAVVTLAAGGEAAPFSPRFTRRPLSDITTAQVIAAVDSLM